MAFNTVSAPDTRGSAELHSENRPRRERKSFLLQAVFPPNVSLKYKHLFQGCYTPTLLRCNLLGLAKITLPRPLEASQHTETLS